MNYPFEVTEPEETYRTAWTLGDFLMILLGGTFISGVELEDALAAELSTPTAIAISLFAQMAGYLLLVILLGNLLRRNWDLLRLRVFPSDVAYLSVGVGVGIVLSLVFGVIAEAVGIETGQGIAETATQPASAAIRITTILLIGLIGPVTEEIVFRGVLLAGLGNRLKANAAVFASATVFAAIHILDFGDQVLLKTLVFGSELLLVGVLLAGLTVKHNRLGPAIFTHIGFNALSLAVLLVLPA